eukprot:UN01669
MRNASAALQAYRRVVHLDPRDYRAWYGLGLTYELLESPSYSIYYFRKACELQPYDYRMWNALAKCYETLHNYDDAIEAYKQAEASEDGMSGQGLNSYNLGRLYEKRNQNWLHNII